MQHVQAQLARQHEATASSAVGMHDEALRTSSGHTMTGKTDLLLRLFDSDFFDEWIAVSYLWRSKTEGVRDYLCNRMYSLDEDAVESYLGQVVTLAVANPSASLDRLVLDFCSRSLRLACKVSWLLSAIASDGRAAHPDVVHAFRLKAETAAIRGTWALPCGAALGSPGGSEQVLALRKSIFEGTLDVVAQLCDASAHLSAVLPADRLASLRQTVDDISEQIEARPEQGIYFPMGRQRGGRVVRLVASEAAVLNSREKAPFLLLLEVVALDEKCCARRALEEETGHPSTSGRALLTQLRVDNNGTVQLLLLVQPPGLLATAELQPAHASQRMAMARAPTAANFRRSGDIAEKWADKVASVRSTSPFGHVPSWRLHPVIVKSGDDCRQEQMAVQIISTFRSIFQEAGLPLWLRPFEVLVTSSHSALIEVITDAPSIHTLKSRLPQGTSLHDHFRARYGHDTPAFRTAQRNFVESMAGYSMVSYLFQWKDRHNGNLLLDEEGHIVHIDFNFMLAHSPGGINFESAPFKLTRELLEVMDTDPEGSSSDAFNYFKVLCIQGFLAARKHADRILLLAEMMQGSNMPCFKGGVKVLHQLRRRFNLCATEEQCVELVLTLIGDSLDAWSMRQYDYYQRVMNGIL